jgi:solute carrier family 13 (sodium-dependent dicarboxylate transporter), member 2/3/5
MSDKKGLMKRSFRVLIAFCLSIGFFIGAMQFLDYRQSALVALVAFMVVLWTNEGLSLGAVSLIPLLMFPLLGIASIEKTALSYMNQIMLLLVGGMLLAISMEKSELHKFISRKIISIFPKTPRGLVYSLAITSAILSAILTNTTITLMLLPVALFLGKDTKVRILLLLAIAYGSSIGGILTPIGTTPNLIYLGLMEQAGGETISFFMWMVLMAPLTFLMLAIIPYWISLGAPSNVELPEMKPERLSIGQKRLLIILGILFAVLLLNSPIPPFYGGLGLNENYILLFFGILMFMPRFGFLKPKDMGNFPVSIILLLGAGFAIAFALGETGLVSMFSSKLEMISTLPLILVIGVVVLFVISLTEIMSNTAIASIMIPVMYGFSQTLGGSSEFLMLAVVVASTMAFMLPIATPPNAIILSSGSIRIRDMVRKGFMVNIIALVLITLTSYFYWRFLLG